MASDPGTVGLNEAIVHLAEQLQQLQTDSRSSAASTRSQTAASGGTSGLSAGGTLLDMFGAGLGLSPLISGIASLFMGGAESSAPLAFPRFALPPSIQADAGMTEAGGPAFAVDRPQGGLPRAAAAVSPTQITVQVQAMDSRSFLDHSADIAMAVRQAMLESSVLNDVVREA